MAIPRIQHSFYKFSPLSSPGNAKNMVEKNLFYMAAKHFDVFGYFNNFIALKPVIINRSADLIARNFAGKSSLHLKEMAAGTGESMILLLQHLQKDHANFYNNVTATLSDGYPEVAGNIRKSALVRPYIGQEKINVAVEDIDGAIFSKARADYIRLSCVLCEMPEDTIRVKDNGYEIAYIRGKVEGEVPFVSPDRRWLSAAAVREILCSGRLHELIDNGLLPPVLNPRIKYEIKWKPIDYSIYGEDAPYVEIALKKITAGVKNAEFKLGFSAASAVEKMLRYHLKNESGSYMELFDSWTSEVSQGMPCAVLEYGLTDVTHPNYPFLKAYMEAKGHKVDIKFEDWTDYVKLNEPYVYVLPFYKWLKQADNKDFIGFFGRDIWGAGHEMRKKNIVKYLSDTEMKYDEVLSSEKEHPFVAILLNNGFMPNDIDLLFSSGRFVEQIKSRTEGYHGNYQIVTIKRI